MIDRSGAIVVYEPQSGAKMNEWSGRKQYWRDTKWQMVATLAPYLLTVLVLPIYAEALNDGRYSACH